MTDELKLKLAQWRVADAEAKRRLDRGNIILTLFALALAIGNCVVFTILIVRLRLDPILCLFATAIATAVLFGLYARGNISAGSEIIKQRREARRKIFGEILTEVRRGMTPEALETLSEFHLSLRN